MKSRTQMRRETPYPGRFIGEGYVRGNVGVNSEGLETRNPEGPRSEPRTLSGEGRNPKAEVRSPKSEVRRKSEIRNPKAEGGERRTEGGRRKTEEWPCIGDRARLGRSRRCPRRRPRGLWPCAPFGWSPAQGCSARGRAEPQPRRPRSPSEEKNKTCFLLSALFWRPVVHGAGKASNFF